MKPVLLPSEAAALDRAAQDRGVTVETLMENAGREVAGAVVRLAGGTYGRRAVIVGGKGNNAGDGLVAARYLDAWGMRVAVVLLAPRADLRGPAGANLARLARRPVRVRAIADVPLARELARADIVVDAIFGTGFRGIPEGVFADAIGTVNDSGVPIVAVDIPSGVNGETAAVDGEAIRADLTVTLGAAKPGVVLLPGASHAGIVEVADIGFPEDLVASDLSVIEGEDVRGWVPVRAPDTHKRDAGYAVVVGGSRSMTGAVALMARAAYRAGAGLVAAAVPESILPVVQGGVREAVFAPLPETKAGSIAGGTDRLGQILEQADAVGIGPGMTVDEGTSAWVRNVVRTAPAPVVLDADGLNAFAGRAGELAERRSAMVLTPHAGEFARLAGIAASEVAADRIGHARKLAAETQAVVLLKGSRTVVAAPDGRARINPTGGPILATGGTGDVLTGMIAGLLARGLEPMDAVSAAAYVHGVAGRLAGDALGNAVTAGDVLDRVPAAFLEVSRS